MIPVFGKHLYKRVERQVVDNLERHCNRKEKMKNGNSLEMETIMKQKKNRKWREKDPSWTRKLSFQNLCQGRNWNDKNEHE